MNSALNFVHYLVTPYSEPSPVSGNISEKNKKYNYFSTKFNTYEEFGKHYVEIYVYYKDLKYTGISEELKPEPFNLICFRDWWYFRCIFGHFIS